MKNLIRFGFVGCLLTFAVPALVADEPPKAKSHETGEAEDPMAAMMAEMMKYATPAQHHEHLKPLAGRWKLTSKFRQAPEADWSNSGGEATIEWILGGRFLTQRVKSPATEEFPMDFEGFGLLGYDNLAKKYISIWADNFMTGVMHFAGSCDASGKVITFAGEFKHPGKGGELAKERWVYRHINDNKFVFEMWQPDDTGKEFMHGEITYDRAG